jgi:hypothetical protein
MLGSVSDRAEDQPALPFALAEAQLDVQPFIQQSGGQSVGPFDEEDGLALEVFFESELAHGLRGEAKKVNVVAREPAGMLVNEGEAGTDDEVGWG